MSWTVYLLDNGTHVIPDLDLVAHQEDDCVCGVSVELIDKQGRDIPDCYMYTHHSLDGREAHE